MRPALKSAFAVSRKIVNTAIGRDVADALAVYRMRSACCLACPTGELRRGPGDRADGAGKRTLPVQPVRRSRGADAGNSGDPPVAKKAYQIGHPREVTTHDAWAQSEARGAEAPSEPMKRLTVDIPESLHTSGSNWAAWPTTRRWPTQSAHCWSSIGQQRKRSAVSAARHD